MTASRLNKNHYDVVIIGYGPVGATMGLLLGKCGIDTLIIDRESSAYHLPRAVHFDDEVMRVFQTAGCADAVAKTLRVNPGMRFVNKEGELLLDWPRPQEVSKHQWYPSYRFHQPDLEQLMRADMRNQGTVEVCTDMEALEINDGETGVSLTLRDRKNECEVAISAGYVVGCDGARSLVRQTMNVGQDNYGFDERWLVIDVILNQDKPELGDHSIQYCNPDRPGTYVRSPGMRRRWEITVLENETNEEITQPERVWELLSPWLSPDEAVLERAAVYTFNSIVFSDWRRGHLMIAGDAAHLTPPFMGQGMCAGVRDASNLAWKLALCVKGLADDSLLDTYTSERIPNAAEYIKTAVRLGGLINTCGTEEALRAAFKSGDNAGDADNARSEGQRPAGPAKMKSISPSLGQGLQAGDTRHTGQLFGQPRLENGARADDLAGYQYVLYANADLLAELDDADIQKLSQSLPPLKGELPVISTAMSPDLQGYLDELEVKAILSRPDRYIQGAASNVNELRELIASVLPSPLTPAQSVVSVEPVAEPA